MNIINRLRLLAGSAFDRVTLRKHYRDECDKMVYDVRLECNRFVEDAVLKTAGKNGGIKVHMTSDFILSNCEVNAPVFVFASRASVMNNIFANSSLSVRQLSEMEAANIEALND